MWRLRWVYVYHNSRGTIAGMWNNPGTNPVDQAWTKPSDSLLWARIEGKNWQTAEKRVFAEMSGQDFMIFQWMAEASINAFGGISASYTPHSRLTGLKIIGRNQELEVYVNGNVITKPNINHQNINFARF